MKNIVLSINSKIKIIFYVFIFCLTFYACSDDGIDGVSVKFYNETGYYLEELNIGGKHLGTLEINGNTDYLNYDKFGFDSWMPDEKCNGTIDNEFIESFNRFYFCGVDKHFIDEGNFEMSINLYEIDSVKYFRIDLR